MMNTDRSYVKIRTLLKASGHFIHLPVCFMLLCSFAFASQVHDFSHAPLNESCANDRMPCGASFQLPNLKLPGLPTGTTQDSNIVAGTKALEEGKKLAEQNTKESHLKAIEKYEEAARFFGASGLKLGEAIAFLAMAGSYTFLHQNQKALDYGKQALPLVEAEGNPTILASALNIIGLLYSSISEHQKAVEYLNRALPLAQGENNPTLLASTLMGLGTAYAHRGERQKAAGYYDKALAIFRSINDPGAEATTLTAIAAVYSKVGEQQKALELFTQALPLVEKAQDVRGKVNTLSGIGGVYSALGDKQKALHYYEQALAVIGSTGDSFGKATALNNIGIIYDDMGYKEKALDFFNQSLQLRRSIDGSKGESAKSLHNIGAVYTSMNEYQKALDFYFKALESARAGQDLDGQASIPVSIGIVYLRLGEQRKALEYFLQSLPLFRFLSDRENEATTLDLIGVAYQCCDKQKALDYHNQALALGRAIQDRSVQSYALGHIADIYMALGERQKALDIYNQVLPLIREIGSRVSEAPILNGIGVIHAKSKEYRKALEFYERALLIEREVIDRRGEAATLGNIGSIHEEQGNLEKAVDYYQKAIDIQEKIRAEARLEEFKIKLAEQSLNVYVNAILINMRLGRSLQAFDLSERARARAFLDQLGNARVDIRKGADAQLIQKEQALRFEIRALEQQLAQERAKSKPGFNTETIAALEKQLLLKRVGYEDFLTDLKLKAPEYASIFSVDSPKLSEVQKGLDKDTTLISYFVTLNNTLAFVITRDSFQAILLPIKGDEISAQIVSFRSFADLRDPYPQPLKKLYGMLISPLKPYIKTRRIGIIPHNILNYLPFSALVDGQRYYGDDHVVFYLPSASVLYFIQQNRKPIGNSLLALAQGQSEGLPFLQYADKSAKDVANLYNTTALSDSAATETALRARAANSNVVFIAAHGKLNTLTPLFSQIVLAPDKSNDGLLEVYEVYGLDLKNVNLVVLSGCETQLGERSQGDDIIGLNRAFIYAGTPTVVASLWSVKEQQTGELMVAFFKYLKQGISKSEALQRAQQDIRNKYPHPYYWAAFVLTGDPGTPPLNSTFKQ